MDLSPEDILAAIDRAVEELLDAAGISAPPVDAVAIAVGHLGIPITDEPPPRRTRRGTVRGLYLAPEWPEEKRNAAVARAVGERQEEGLLDRIGVPEDERRGLKGVSLPGLFADHMLTPTRWLRDESRRCGFDLLAVHEQFRTASLELIARRWIDLTDPCVVAIVDGERVEWRRSNAARATKELSPAEDECRRRVWDTGEPQAVRRDGWDVRGWPVADTGRIVLRSVHEGM